jgi:Tfp pilus assembly protein PilF
MKKFLPYLFAYLLFLIATQVVADAQDEARAAWQVSRFDVTVTVPNNVERALTSRAVLTVRNVGRAAGSSLTLRINPIAEVKAVSVNDATASFRSAQESRGNLQRITIRLPISVAPDASLKVAMDYRLPVAENNGVAALSPTGSQFLPRAFWYPAPNTLFAARGADTAPYRLTVTTESGEKIVSSGAGTQAGTTTRSETFEQTLNAQPFFLTGSWDVIDGANDARGISAWLPKGAAVEERKQADQLITLAAQARAFYVNLLGGAPNAPIRLIAVTRGAGFNEAGTALLDAAAFRRPKIDSVTALLIGETMARLWIGGAAALRGEGTGVLREGLPRYLTTLFIEQQFGRDAAEGERARERAAYAAIAKRDAPLSQTTPLDDTYFTAAANKGALVWRLVDRALGREAFLSVLRGQLQAAANGNALTLAAVRSALIERGGANLKTILDQELDQPTDMDLLVGLPQQRGAAQWAAALRNTGSLDATVSVAATTERGERLSVDATIPARGFGEAVFNTSARITRVEVDPDKLYPQLDYTNDVAPRAALTEDALAEAGRAFARGDYQTSETTARQLLSIAPHAQEARILLARSLLAQNKLDEAEREFRAALDEKLPTPAMLAWGNVGLGEINLRRGRNGEAAKYFNDAVRIDADYASTLAARAGRVKAETAAHAAPAVDESARAFIAQLDAAIKAGRRTELESFIMPGELGTFLKGIVGSQPELWQTRVLRTEELGADRLAADVALNVRELGRDQSGTAVYILARTGGGNWKLAAIEFFEVR